MIFTINTKVLLQTLQYVSKAVSSKSPHPLLTGILVKTRKDEIVFTASNSDIYIESTLKDESLKVSEEGINVFPKLFVDIITKISNEEMVNISVFDDVATIQTKASNFKLNCISSSDNSYPEQVFDFSCDALSIKADQLKNIISTTSYCANGSDNRPILQGVCFRVQDNKLICVATDSYRLARKEFTLDKAYPNKEVVIPYRTLSEINKILPTYNFDIDIYFTFNKVIFKYENMIFSSRLLEGNYPQTDKLIPSEFPLEIKFNREDLKHATDIANLFKNNNQDNIVILSIKQNGFVELKSYDNGIGSSREEIMPLNEIKGRDFVVAFNAKHLMDALETFLDKEVTVHFTSSVKQFIVTSEKEKDQIQLLLPVRAD